MDSIQVAHSGLIELPRISDHPDGVLCVMEVGRHIPFPIRRVYYINNLENCVSVRGKHAHRTLEQVIFCISGSFVLDLDDGQRQQSIRLERDNVGVRLGAGLWHCMRNFSSGCLLLVVASAPYDEADYIRDHDEFLAWVRAGA